MDNLLYKLALGTVQFGMEYGINNQFGKPTISQSVEMLELAYVSGIRVFDTAHAYGDAEEILGIFMQNHKADNEIKIITKLKPNVISENVEDIEDAIKTNFHDSLQRLKIDAVDGYLLHTPAYIRQDKVVEVLSDLKEQKLVKNIGVSIYDESDALYAAELAAVDYIQIPYSIFDQRLRRTNFFKLTAKNKKTVFARSAFLQGLFLMPNNEIPSHLSKVKLYFDELDKIINKYNISRLEAALLFSYSNKDIDFVVFGVDNIEQLREDFSIIEKKIDFSNCLGELKDKFLDIEKSIIFPSLWKK